MDTPVVSKKTVLITVISVFASLCLILGIAFAAFTSEKTITADGETGNVSVLTSFTVTNTNGFEGFTNSGDRYTMDVTITNQSDMPVYFYPIYEILTDSRLIDDINIYIEGEYKGKVRELAAAEPNKTLDDSLDVGEVHTFELALEYHMGITSSYTSDDDFFYKDNNYCRANTAYPKLKIRNLRR